MRFQRGRTSAKKGKTNELTCLREVFVFGDAHNPYAIGRVRNGIAALTARAASAVSFQHAMMVPVRVRGGVGHWD